MSSAGAVVEDVYLTSLKISRTSPSVLKHALITLKSEVGNIAILVFEGVDDKIVYHHWLNRIDSDFEYEPFTCEGKRYVLSLLDVVNNDLNGLSDNVYFFVDKDFDEVADHPACPNLFVTDTYAIENYIVHGHTVRELIKTHFHCSCGPVKRGAIIGTFVGLYGDFLDITKEINFRTYAARKLNINASLPDKISKIANVELLEVKPVATDVREIVRLERELSDEEERLLRESFELLDKTMHYRGKYASMFFKKWIDLALKDRNSDEDSKLFEGIKTKAKATPVSLDCMAAKSPIPKDLLRFLKSIPVV